MKTTMTKLQKTIWDKALEGSLAHEFDFVFFLDDLDTWCGTVEGEPYFIDEVFPEFRNDSRRLMMAWLYPETIEVAE
ncbi:hypothetical protein [Jeotgalibaca porci]|uniref:hypothetical protein n=1 Tax=Jeotgalibaca porci TaxID=1868793 RepID=UPI0035A1AB7A